VSLAIVGENQDTKPKQNETKHNETKLAMVAKKVVCVHESGHYKYDPRCEPCGFLVDFLGNSYVHTTTSAGVLAARRLLS
jgi:hypothetical protein